MVIKSPSSERDPLSVELIALCAVGKALASLEDPEARLRVLRWANERFQPASTAPAQAPAPAEEPASAPVPALRLAPEPDPAVDGLDDLFEEPAVAPPTRIVEDSCGVPGDAEDLSDLYELPSEPARPQLHLVTREELPFDQLVDDFVDSFRRLTRESQRLT